MLLKSPNSEFHLMGADIYINLNLISPPSTLTFLETANRFLFLNPPLFALGHEPSFFANRTQATAFSNFFPESAEQLLLGFILS